MVRIYDFFYPPDQEQQLLSIVNGAGPHSVLPMERKGVCRDSDIRVMRATGHLEGSEDAFQRMEAELAKQGYQFIADHDLSTIAHRPDRQRRKQLLKGFKSQIKEQQHAQELERTTLPDRIIRRHEFLDVATCTPDCEMLGDLAPIPIDRDQYSIVDVLVCFMAVMSVRYGLDQRRMQEVCRFLGSFSLEELNAELQAGRTFLIVPTNRKPKLVDQSLQLTDLRELCGHGYPGLLLDIASFVEDVRAGLRKLESRGP